MIEWQHGPIPSPGPGEVLIEHEAVGLNFIDTYHRRGIYPIPLPSGLGLEAAGRITALGEGVTGHAVGDRVAYIGPGLGAYATHRVMPAGALFPLPDHVSCEVAAAALIKAFTVEALVERCAHVKAGDTVLVHAAAGGVGLLMVQWLAHLGVEVIGTVSSDTKAELARNAGAAHIIRYDHEAVAPRVREITGGTGVPVVFDGDRQAGGMIRSQIPKFRLPDSVIDEECGYILDRGGVVSHQNRRVDSLKALLAEGYDAVFVGSGAPRG